jgi:nicotinamidase/pyrazinamidase
LSGFDTDKVQQFFPKGMDCFAEQYSCVGSANGSDNGPIVEWLRERDVVAVDVAGLALEVCVAVTAKELAILGFETRVLLSLVGSLGSDRSRCDEAVQHGVSVIN